MIVYLYFQCELVDYLSTAWSTSILVGSSIRDCRDTRAQYMCIILNCVLTASMCWD